MSSGWPPEEDDRRWEPARHPSAVGAVHDSRGAEGGYSDFAGYDAGGQYPEGQYPEGQYPDGQYRDGQYSDGDPGGWYGTAETSYPAADYRPEPDNAGYGQVSYPDVYDLSGSGEGYTPTPAYGPPAGYSEHPSFPNLAAPPPYSAPPTADYDTSGYEQAGDGYAAPDYGYADYGDSRYDDPSFVDPVYDPPRADYPAPGPADAGQAPVPAQPQASGPAGAYADYYQYPPSYDDTDHGYGPVQGYGSPDTAAPGYVAAEYASGQFPDGVGALGELTAGLPDPAATGMVDASGMLDATGIADHDELYNYHPNAGAEAAHAFADAPAPMGTVDTSGLPMPPDATTIDGHAPILGGAQAADATGVLDGGTASTYFDGGAAYQAAPTFAPGYHADRPGYDGDPAGYDADRPGYAGDVPAYAGDPAYAGGPAGYDDPSPAGAAPTYPAAADATSLDLPPTGRFDRGPADSTSIGPAGTGAFKTGGTGALLRPRSTRPAGKRRGGSNDHRLWFALGGVVAVAAIAIVAIVMLAFPSGPSGPAHTLVSPNQLGAFTRRPALEQQMNVGQLRQDVINTSSGQASHIVEGVYESGSSTSGATPQIILLIGGNLANGNPADSVTSFTKRFKGATLTSAGALGGKAVCVNANGSEPGSVAMCAWFDNDSFGEVVSPTMKADALASTMRQIRPKVELVAPKKS